MNILAAFDKFKDSMTADAACQAVSEAVAASLEKATVLHAPLTDGGEGFAGILASAAGGELREVAVSGPLGRPVQASIGWIEATDLNPGVQQHLAISEGRLAVLEMASAAGLEQVPKEERHPKDCSTRGVGELIARATVDGASAILLGIGGSATSDLGLGALEALGLRFFDSAGKPVTKVFPRDWARIRSIGGHRREDLPPLYVACDVDNPLLGPSGAAAVYGPQKGLRNEELEAYEQESARLADLLLDAVSAPPELKNRSGSGAAGGTGFGLMAACGATLVPGFPLVTAWLGLPEKMAEADLVFTGEGKFDCSSLSGKGPYSLLQQAARSGKPAILLAGAIDEKAAADVQRECPGTRLMAISPPELPLAEALREGPANLRRAAERALQDLSAS